MVATVFDVLTRPLCDRYVDSINAYVYVTDDALFVYCDDCDCDCDRR